MTLRLVCRSEGAALPVNLFGFIIKTGDLSYETS